MWALRPNALDLYSKQLELHTRQKEAELASKPIHKSIAAFDVRVLVGGCDVKPSGVPLLHALNARNGTLRTVG